MTGSSADGSANRSSADASRLDPVTAEILRAALVAITDEMKTNLMRTAYNVIIYEAQDFTVGLFDAEGNTISIGLGLPMFVGGLSEAIKAELAFYGRDGIAPGDVLLTNDAYVMGSHLNHMIFTLPVFHDGELVAFAASMAHWVDVGGVLGGTTHDIYSEGLQMPMVKIFKGGVQDDELTRIITSNVRFEDLAMGDFRAQVAAIRTGETRMHGLLERYGNGLFRAAVDDMYQRSERLARRAVAAIPDGDYHAEAAMDDDGISDRPIPIRVTVRVRGADMTIDLSEMSPQVAGYFNSGDTAGRSAAKVAFKCLTSPQDYPINDGALRAVEVVLPPGTVVSATKPAAMRWWMTYPMTLVDVIFRALSQAMPESTIAGHHADLAVATLYGTEEATGRLFLYFGGGQGGGWGATRRSDGQSATICINDGDTHNTPVEASEAKYPALLFEHYRLRTDSGGPGRHRGGLGTSLRVRTSSAVRFNSFIDRTKVAPWGLDEGGDALPNGLSILRGGAPPEQLSSGKVDGLLLGIGDGYVIDTGGGGGYGDPYRRPAADVLADVRLGYVTITAAARDYGVVVRTDDWVVDEPNTHRLRALVASQRLLPATPGH